MKMKMKWGVRIALWARLAWRQSRQAMSYEWRLTTHDSRPARNGLEDEDEDEDEKEMREERRDYSRTGDPVDYLAWIH
jgi:hypothetical protein